MKKIIFTFLAALSIISMASCSQQEIARKYGGELNVQVPAGYKVTSATWKENDLFYFMEPMEDEYVPKEKIFMEKSSYGIMQTKVTFKETK